MARILPFVGNTFLFSQLEAGVNDIGTMTAPPANSLIISGAWYNETAWTVGGGTTTGLDVQLGDAANDDELLEELDLVGVAADLWSTLGAVPTKYGQWTLETAYVPVVTFTATGGGTELDDVDAGQGAMCMFYAHLPEGATVFSVAAAATF
jgi:hypothetical protein